MNRWKNDCVYSHISLTGHLPILAEKWKRISIIASLAKRQRRGPGQWPPGSPDLNPLDF
jgi:hypothetical protein